MQGTASLETAQEQLVAMEMQVRNLTFLKDIATEGMNIEVRRLVKAIGRVRFALEEKSKLA